MVAGRFRGRQLKSPPGLETRPTGARVRKALFDILGPSLEGALVADCFAGTGALGLEALSRGAARIEFHENSRPALGVIHTNIEMLGVASETRLVPGDLPDSLRAGPAYDLVLLDPPWRRGLEGAVIKRLLALKRISPTTIVVVERDTRDVAVEAALAAHGLEAFDRRLYGDTTLCLFRLLLAPPRTTDTDAP